MALHHCSTDPSRRGSFDDATWNQVYSSLRPHVRRWVYTSGIPSWRGQEEDIVEDIVQVSVVRTYTYTSHPQDANSSPLRLPQAMAYRIARNYYNDLRRHDGRIDRFSTDEQVYQEKAVDYIELALENMYVEWLLMRVAYAISRFPEKQRRALLIDLAKLTDFDEQPTVFRRALLGFGIRLQDYRLPRSVDPTMRSRQASLLSTAYRRLRESQVETQQDKSKNT
jgi:DNA-directed RNA polymerase specialized sigma24 family protein